jgi:RNA polymerase sigma-70 factor (ECF subfamily)
MAFLGRCLPEDVAGSLASLRADDLYLACAYGRGVPGAYEAFEQYCMRAVAAALRRARIPAALAADVEQDLRRRLVEMQAPRPDRKVYAGRGDLAGWLSITALREARRRGAREARDQPLVTAEDLLLSPDEDPEAAFLRKTYKPELTRAFQEAVASLSAEERNLLRYHFLKNLTIDEIGRLYGVHRATAARRINRAREALCARTQELFRARIAVGTGSYLKLLPLIESQLRIQLATLPA